MKEKILQYFKVLGEDLKNINKENVMDIIKKRVKLLGVLTLCFFMVLGFFLGSITTSKEGLLSKLESALKEGNGRKLSSIVYMDGEKLSKKELEPLVKYYSLDRSRVDNLISTLKVDGINECFEVYKEKGIFGDKYELRISPVKIKIQGGYSEAEFSLGDEVYYKNGEEIKNIVPGIHTIYGRLQGGYGDIEMEKEIVALKNQEINFDFEAITVKVKSPYLDGQIFINGVDSGAKVKDGKNFGPFNKNEENKIHIEFEFPWGKNKSEEVLIGDNKEINLDINMVNETLNIEVEEVIEQFYNSVFNSLNKEDKSLIKGGSENAINKLYSEFEKNYFILKNQYEIEAIDIQKDRSQFRYDNGVYTATIVVEVDYSVKKKFLGLNVEKNSKLFFTKIIYNGLNWQIEDVENFSL